jgi:hypothetical protein
MASSRRDNSLPPRPPSTSSGTYINVTHPQNREGSPEYAAEMSESFSFDDTGYDRCSDAGQSDSSAQTLSINGDERDWEVQMDSVHEDDAEDELESSTHVPTPVNLSLDSGVLRRRMGGFARQHYRHANIPTIMEPEIGEIMDIHENSELDALSSLNGDTDSEMDDTSDEEGDIDASELLNSDLRTLAAQASRETIMTPDEMHVHDEKVHGWKEGLLRQNSAFWELVERSWTEQGPKMLFVLVVMLVTSILTSRIVETGYNAWQENGYSSSVSEPLERTCIDELESAYVPSRDTPELLKDLGTNGYAWMDYLKVGSGDAETFSSTSTSTRASTATVEKTKQPPSPISAGNSNVLPKWIQQKQDDDTRSRRNEAEKSILAAQTEKALKKKLNLEAKLQKIQEQEQRRLKKIEDQKRAVPVPDTSKPEDKPKQRLGLPFPPPMKLLGDPSEAINRAQGRARSMVESLTGAAVRAEQATEKLLQEGLGPAIEKTRAQTMENANRLFGNVDAREWMRQLMGMESVDKLRKYGAEGYAAMEAGLDNMLQYGQEELEAQLEWVVKQAADHQISGAELSRRVQVLMKESHSVLAEKIAKVQASRAIHDQTRTLHAKARQVMRHGEVMRKSLMKETKVLSKAVRGKLDRAQRRAKKLRRKLMSEENVESLANLQETMQKGFGYEFWKTLWDDAPVQMKSEQRREAEEAARREGGEGSWKQTMESYGIWFEEH